ncbi:MAG: alpha-amylase family glycosyl hydrolase, partial [Thermomicrobiales bacterium]
GRRPLLIVLLTLILLTGPGIAMARQATPSPAATSVVSGGEWWHDAVCYEVFVRSFYDSDGDGIGDINGLIEKLDYLNDGKNHFDGPDLGVNCIWLMPVFESASYHGYDVVDYRQIDQDYGTNDDFKRLVAEAARRGIRIILDLVLNHTSSEHPWFQEALSDPGSPYRDFYIWADEKPEYKGPWGQEVWHKSPVANEYYYGIFWEGMPDLNYRNPHVTMVAEKITHFWLNAMGVDGFRLDAIKHLIEDGPVQENTPETHEWLRGYGAFVEGIDPEALTVGEIFGATPSVLTPYYPDQLDSYFLFQIGETLHAAANFGPAGPFVTAVDRAEEELPDQRFAPFLTNHDQTRSMTLLENVEEAKVAALALLTLPGIPFIYYGEEIGMTGTKPDERLRTPMPWTGEATGGFTTGTPWEPLQPDAAEINVAAQTADLESLLHWYRLWIRRHLESPALRHGDFTPVQTSERSVAAYLRQSEDQIVLVVINFGKEQLDGVTLSVDESGLAPGSYNPSPMLGDAPFAPVSVTEGGGIRDYVPLPTLGPLIGYAVALTPQ